MALNEQFLKIGQDIIGAAFEVRKHSGSHFHEKYYELTLAYELTQKGYEVKRQEPIKIIYKGVDIDEKLYADLLVNDQVIVELKALSCVGTEAMRQLNTYLKLTGKKLGYIINFGAPDFSVGNLKSEPLPFERGIYRMVNGI